MNRVITFCNKNPNLLYSKHRNKAGLKDTQTERVKINYIKAR